MDGLSGLRRVWVTRAEPGASRTAARLTALGFEPVVQPLLVVRPISQPAPDLTGVAALAFTSANGLDAFAALTPQRDLPVFTVGDATAEAAMQAGFVAVRSARGAAPDLARLLDAEAPGLVLAITAREPSADLQKLVKAAQIRALAVYETVETDALPPDSIDAVLIHSPRAARALAGLWPRWGGCPVIAAISVAAAAPVASLADVAVAERPDEAALFLALGKPPSRL